VHEKRGGKTFQGFQRPRKPKNAPGADSTGAGHLRKNSGVFRQSPKRQKTISRLGHRAGSATAQTQGDKVSRPQDKGGAVYTCTPKRLKKTTEGTAKDQQRVQLPLIGGGELKKFVSAREKRTPKITAGQQKKKTGGPVEKNKKTSVQARKTAETTATTGAKPEPPRRVGKDKVGGGRFPTGRKALEKEHGNSESAKKAWKRIAGRLKDRGWRRTIRLPMRSARRARQNERGGRKSHNTAGTSITSRYANARHERRGTEPKARRREHEGGGCEGGGVCEGE